MIYLDYAATTPMLPAALAVMQEVLAESYGNPSSMHQAGRTARNILTKARESIASSLGAGPREIYFTSGATEANNWALVSVCRAGRSQGKIRIITSAIEHASILATCDALAKEGFTIIRLTPNADGVVAPDQVEAAIQEDLAATALVSIQWVNNEIGVVQDVEAIGRVCQTLGVPFHTDAVQAIGHLPLVWESFPADYLSLSAHKFGGPKGTGLLLARKAPDSFIHGGRQERGRRAGTENLAGIAAMAKALELTCSQRISLKRNLCDYSKGFLSALQAKGLSFILHGPELAASAEGKRLPSILNLYFPRVDGQTLLLLLDRAGICVSLGSACEAGSVEASHVLLALGFSEEEAGSSIRFSLGPTTSPEDLAYSAEQVALAIAKLQR